MLFIHSENECFLVIRKTKFANPEEQVVGIVQEYLLNFQVWKRKFSNPEQQVIDVASEYLFKFRIVVVI